MTDEFKMLDIKDIMRIFNIKRYTIYDWVKKERFSQPIKIGKKIFWKPENLKEYLDSKEAEAKTKETKDKCEG